MVIYMQKRLYDNLSEEIFYHDNYISMEYGQLWLASVEDKKIEISTRGTNSMPFLVFRRGHYCSPQTVTAEYYAKPCVSTLVFVEVFS